MFILLEYICLVEILNITKYAKILGDLMEQDFSALCSFVINVLNLLKWIISDGYKEMHLEESQHSTQLTVLGDCLSLEV